MSGQVEEQIPDQFAPTSKITVRCRPKRLFEIIPKLKDVQISAVRRIGFGGMLELKFKHFPLDNISLFMDCFDDGSYVFRAPKSKHFMVSKHDVHDCFLLPCGPNELELLPTGPQKGSDSVENVELKTRWREMFGINSSNGSIPIGKLKDAIEEDEEGGDHFCRLFVLFCMSSFLAPTINNGVDFKLLRAVEDVSAIHRFDWCSYVLQAIVGACEDVNTKQSSLVGCIPFLMITYFQRFDFRGQICPHDLPLIKHWDEARLKSRIKGEVADGGLGRQTWSIVKYPRCIHAPSNNPVIVTGNPQFHNSSTKQVVSTSTSTSKSVKKFIEIEIPEGLEDDQQLKDRALDPIHELYLKLQRNSVAFHAWYADAISSIKHAMKGSIDSVGIVPSQASQDFWQSEELHRYCDLVELNAKRMKQSVANAPVLGDLLAATRDTKGEQHIATVQLSEILCDLKKDELVEDFHEMPTERPCDDAAVSLANDMPTNELVPSDQVFYSGLLDSTPEINGIIMNLRKETEDSDSALMADAGYTPAEIAVTLDKMRKGDNDISQGRISPASVYVPHTDLIHPPQKTDPKRLLDDEVDCEVTYKRRRSSTPTAVVCPSAEPLSVLSSRRRGKGDGLGCSLDCGPVSGLATLVVSNFLRNNQTLCKNVKDLRKHVADYGFLDDNGMPNIEVLARYGPNATIRRDDIVSMLPDVLMSSFVIESWAMLLNTIESDGFQPARMAFFGLRHTDVLMQLLDTPTQCSPGGSKLNMLYKVWDIYVKDCGKTINLDANLIFIPIQVDDHVACACINFNSKTVDILDNQSHPDPTKSVIFKAAFILVSAMSDYLEYKGVTKGSLLPTFEHRQIMFDWVRPPPLNEESGIFTMVHMLVYEGHTFKNSDLDNKKSRRYLVVQLAATLILADVNCERDEVMEKINLWISNKDIIWTQIQARRRLAKLLTKKSK